MKPLVILNPHSQGGRTGKLADGLLKVISRYVGEVDRIDTDRPRHACAIAEQAAREGRDTVIVVGGDGTISEVVNGLMQARASGVAVPKLGIVGQGTGGDFRRTLGLEHRLDHYCEVIARGETRAIDIGEFSFTNNAGIAETAYFVNILSTGMSGLADRHVATASRRFGGAVAYFGASFKALLESQVAVLKCTVGVGGESQDIDVASRILAICNGRYFGSGMEVAPMAQPDDGLFHVVSLGDAPRLRFMMSTLSIYKGTHIDNPGVEVFACDRLSVDVASEDKRGAFPLDVDGEALGMLPLEVTLIPHAIEIFV
jgi:YegS/Rv2252/BmrU family lipid kinase